MIALMRALRVAFVLTVLAIQAVPVLATVSSTASSITAQGNGAATSWPFSFVIPGTTTTDQTNVLVSVVDTTVSPPTTTVLANNQYTITGISTPNSPSTSGSVTYPLAGPALAAGKYLTVQRNVPLTQTTSFPNQGAIYPKVIEGTFDSGAMSVQQVANQAKLALQVSPSDPGGAPAALPLASARANKFLGFDSSGNPIATAASNNANPTGPAGGDLSGTYPNPAVANVRGVAVNSVPASGNLVGTTDSQTLTNKTLTSPTLTAPVFSSISNTGTLTLPTSTDTLVGRATSDTLTNKTLTSPAINTPTLTGSGGTLTLPAGPDTIVGRATTDTFTNKTFDSAGTGNALKISGVTISAGQLPGTATNDTATAGNIGETVSSTVLSGSAISLTTDTPVNVTSISLTAGDWDIWGTVLYTGGATTTVRGVIASINTTSATLSLTPGNLAESYYAAQTMFTDGNRLVHTIPQTRVSLSSTTTFFLVTQTKFAVSTMSTYGAIFARRRR